MNDRARKHEQKPKETVTEHRIFDEVQEAIDWVSEDPENREATVRTSGETQT